MECVIFQGAPALAQVRRQVGTEEKWKIAVAIRADAHEVNDERCLPQLFEALLRAAFLAVIQKGPPGGWASFGGRKQAPLVERGIASEWSRILGINLRIESCKYRGHPLCYEPGNQGGRPEGGRRRGLAAGGATGIVQAGTEGAHGLMRYPLPEYQRKGRS
jgi:hypothetical protein